MLPKTRPRQCLRFAAGQERGLCPGRIDPTASRPTLPRPPSPPRRAPPRPDGPVGCPGFPGHALHKKDLRKQIGVGTLVSSQERRALAVLLITRSSTANQPRVNRGSTADFFPPSVYIGFRLFVLPNTHPGQCLRFAGGQEGGLSPGRIDPTACRPTQA